MSGASSYVVTLPASVDLSHSRAEDIDTSLTYRFGFARQRWFSGLGSLAQGGLMMGVGGFLFSQVAATPNLRVQMSIVASLLVLGGLALASRCLADFFGSVILGPGGFRARLGLRGFTVDWNEVKSWRVNESAIQFPELSAVELTLAEDCCGRSVPGGYLSAKDQHQVRHLLAAFVDGREDS